MKWSIIIAAGVVLLLAGCAGMPTVQRVDVPVPVSCLPAQMPARPDIHTSAMLRAMSSSEYVLATSADRLDLLAYAGELEAVLRGCE